MASGRLFVAALRGAIIGSFVFATGLALILGASRLWAQMPVQAPADRNATLALPVAVLVCLVVLPVLYAKLESSIRDGAAGSLVDYLPYSLLALVGVVVAVSVAGFAHPELKESLVLSLNGIGHGQFERFVAVAAIHADPGHLVNNMLGAALLAPSLVVLRVGTRTFWITVAAALAAGDAVSLIFHPLGSLGFSGVLAGISGVLLVAAIRHVRHEPDRLMRLAYALMGGPAGWTFVSMVFMALSGAPVNNAAHIAGLLAGVAVSALPFAARALRQRSRLPKPRLGKLLEGASA